MTPPTGNPCKRVVVLDTSAFLAGFDPFSFIGELVTVPLVEEEIKRSSIVKVRVDAALENGKVKIKVPSQKFLERVMASAGKLGDSFKLSETDLQLLALASELKAEGYKVQIVSDDYSIQNVAAQLGIEFFALATFGIKRLLEWVRYCPACRKEYPVNSRFGECQVCGTPLKRKPRRTVKSLKPK